MPFSLLLLLRAELCLPCCFLYSVENMPQASRSTSPFCVNIAVLPHWTSDGFMTCFNLQKFCKDYNSIMKLHVANPVCLLRTTKKSTQWSPASHMWMMRLFPPVEDIFRVVPQRSSGHSHKGMPYTSQSWDQMEFQKERLMSKWWVYSPDWVT